jgi:hypothetical protein
MCQGQYQRSYKCKEQTPAVEPVESLFSEEKEKEAV